MRRLPVLTITAAILLVFAFPSAAQASAPFTFVKTWGSSGSGPGQFKGASDLAVDPGGYVYVVDVGNHRVQKFDLAGNFVSYVSGATDPISVAVDGTGKLYVLSGGDSVKRYGRDGGFLGQWSVGSTNGGGIAVGPDVIYVSRNDFTDATIAMFTTSGGSLGTRWAGPNYFPVNKLALDKQGNLYACFHNPDDTTSITKTLPSGKEVGEWANLPPDARITCMDNGNVVLTDAPGNCVHIRTPTLQLVGTLGTAGTAPGKFSAPTGVGFDAAGNMYVSESGNNRVQKFAPSRLAVDWVKVTNPVAYELKSLLTTRFLFSSNLPAATGKIEIQTASGWKTVKSNIPIAAANTTVSVSWDGKIAGRRIPSAAYNYRVILTKSGQTASKGGKLLVSKIYFSFKGSSAWGFVRHHTGYMVPGNANVYISADPWSGTSDSLRISLRDPYTYRRTLGTWAVPAPPGHLNATAYIRYPYQIRTRSIHTFNVSAARTAGYEVGVIQ
jgi:sugar lactone lactonase YvrE